MHHSIKNCGYISITTPKRGFIVPILSKSVQKCKRYGQNFFYFLKCLSEFRFNETTDYSFALRGYTEIYPDLQKNKLNMGKPSFTPQSDIYPSLCLFSTDRNF
jgi:hypothetical protein